MNKVLKISIVVVICLIVILAATLIFSQCSNDTDKTTTTTTKPTTSSSTTSSTTSSSQGGTVDPDPDCTEHVDANTDYVCDVCGEQLEKPDDGFTATNDKVYVITTQLNIRKTPDTTGNPVAAVLMDAELTRLGYYTNGWSKIVYDGEECYVMTEFVTTQKPITEFTTVDEKVYLVRNSIVYSKPSKITGYSEEMDTLFKNASVTRIGVATEPFIDTDGTEITFAKIKYTKTVDGHEVTSILYVNNANLTTDTPIDLNPDGEVSFESNSDVLVSKSESFWLRKSTFYGGEYTESEKAKKISAGTILQAIGKGIESDGTVWYKVTYEGATYYAIYKPEYFDIQQSQGSSVQTVFGEYNITLPEGMTLTVYDETSYMAIGEEVIAVVVNTGEIPDGSLTPKAFLEAFVIEMGYTNAQVLEKDGLFYVAYQYSQEISGETYTEYSLSVVHEGSNNNFYLTQLIAESDLIDTFWGYIDTIEITPAA